MLHHCRAHWTPFCGYTLCVMSYRLCVSWYTVTVMIDMLQARADQGTTVSFPIIPTTIGQMRVKVTALTSGAADAVQRDLLVEVCLHTLWLGDGCPICLMLISLLLIGVAGGILSVLRSTSWVLKKIVSIYYQSNKDFNKGKCESEVNSVIWFPVSI